MTTHHHYVPKVGFVSLGCPKNLVDSERILTKLRSDGYEVVPNYEGADIVVVNTCGFINAAVTESLETIGEALVENGKVLVTGCLGKQKELIMEEHPNVLGISGAHEYEAVVEAVHKHVPIAHDAYSALVPEQGIKLTPRHFAYLKISEGCNNTCTFCIIPSFRGKLVSRPIEKVLREAERLAQAGVKELLIISQDTSAYGVDLKYQAGSWQGEIYQTRLFDLATALSRLGIWVRFHYVYPYPHVDKIIPLMAEGKILPYLDIPFQHASPRILKLMKRPAKSANTLESIKRWRKMCPELIIRSTFIVGFPGETEAEFEALLDFLEEAKLNRVGCFMYSDVDGARANDLPDAVPEEVKQERLEKFMAVQEQISAELLQQRIGLVQKVLIDMVDIEEDIAIARSQYDAPEVDGIVAIENIKDKGLKAGQFVEVRIIDADGHDCVGELV